MDDWQPTLPSTAHPELARLITDLQNQLGKLSISTVKLQLDLHDKVRTGKNSESALNAGDVATGTLFDTVADKIKESLAENEENVEALQQLEDPLLRRALGRWHNLPYPTWCALVNRVTQSVVTEGRVGTGGNVDPSEERGLKRRKIVDTAIIDEDVDEWIIKNERAVRDEMYQSNTYNPSTKARAGLVRLSDHMDTVLRKSITPLSESAHPVARKIVRNEVDGFKCLDLKRDPFIYVQPSVSAYSQTFDAMTNGILRGLDWSNVFIAGGIALGILLCTSPPDSDLPNPNTSEQWKDSDIDVYIYGLTSAEANNKIRHIFQAICSNLPKGQETLVVRNSKTISILSTYPTRRVQIILKTVKSPKEVLLNFDLDICAIGYDGTEVWMLPRMVRALETGYNVFTMDMIQGHYLRDRRATQEQRVFKYATRGYGIRFLSSYVSSYHSTLPLPQTEARPPRTLDNLQAHTRKWVDHLQGGRESWSGWVAITHSSIDAPSQGSIEPGGRTCLTGLELLLRHVALWEGHVQGRWKLTDGVWHSADYPDWMGGYDDSPKYAWDDQFKLSDFEKSITEYNKKLISEFKGGLAQANNEHWVLYMIPSDVMGRIARMRYGASADDVLKPEADLLIPLMLPEGFVTFAVNVLDQAFLEHNIPERANQILTIQERLPNSSGEENDVIVMWKITALTMWQQVDRRIDEIYEILWTFHRCGCDRGDRPEMRSETFKIQVSRRGARLEREDEFKAFKTWAERGPDSDYSSHVSGHPRSFDSDEEDDWN